MAISTNSEINIYTYERKDGQYMFIPLEQTFQPPVSNQDITSIEFNPNDSNEMVVGFLNVSPQFLKIDTGFFVPGKDIQPLAAKNDKKATYMPDGKRFLSSDALNGIGIWPGVKNTLFYKEGYPLYNIQPSANGTMFIGRVWQQIKVIQI
jgi:WD40 repeat protein